MRILIVDDSATMRRLIAKTLHAIELDGLVLDEAANGVEGLKACGRTAPDLVLSDLHMPEFDGYSMVRKLREDGNDVPVGFITSDGASPSFRKRAAEIGADFVLQKPFNEQQLLDALAGKHEPALQPIKTQLMFHTLQQVVQRTTEHVLGSALAGAQRMLPRVPADMSGALISVVHAGDYTNVGLFGTTETLSGIARRTGNSQGDPSREAIRDCLRELVNVIGGNMRSCFPDERTRLGLPEFVDNAGADPRTAGIAYEVQLEKWPVVLLLQSPAVR